jgi:penicillin amidase
MKRVLVTYVLSAALLVTLTGVRGAGAFSRTDSTQAGQAAPEPATTTLSLPGLRDKVTVRYDDRGIPHISARNESDLFMAQGYVVAKDRLWQMDLLRRTGRGQLAEIFGRAVLDQDKIHRNYGFGPVADQVVEHLSPETRKSLIDYSRGVNAYIKSLDDKSLPVEFRLLQYKPAEWTPSDSAIVGKIFAESLSTTWSFDLIRGALSGLPKEKQEQLLTYISPLDVLLVGSDAPGSKFKNPDQASRAGGVTVSQDVVSAAIDKVEQERESLARVGLYAKDLAASNNWVVSGRHTESGKPLLANDPHLDASAPSIWYMADLSAPGIHVAGVTVPGGPGIAIGHNDRLAWGITNVEADVQDVYIEKFDKDNPGRYMTPTGWKDAVIRHEVINVRKVPTDPATEPVGLDVTVTRHGPIVLEKNGNRYALAWPALDPTTKELEVYSQLDRARNWQDFRGALLRYSGFPLNFVYADMDGHIAWWAAGRYPIRKTGYGTVPYDGSTDAGDWTGYVPLESTPHLVDPPSGIIVTANNRTIGLDYPYYLGYFWAPPYRAKRIHDLLADKPVLGVDDFERIQGDTYSIPTALFAKEVVALARPLANDSPDWTQILASFEDWDGMLNANSHTALLVAFTHSVFRQKIVRGAMGPDLAKKFGWPGVDTLLDRIIQTRPKEWLPKEFDSYQALILSCFKDSLVQLKTRLGPNEADWTWGRLVQVRFPHPLESAPLVGGQFVVAPFPQNGGDSSINRGAEVSMRFIADLNNWDNSRQGIALGESGDPHSPHWKDQLPDWQAVTPAVFGFSESAVMKSTKAVLILAPQQ